MQRAERLTNPCQKTKPDFQEAMQRIEAWLNQDILDRVPIQFRWTRNPATGDPPPERQWDSLKERWLDTSFQLNAFIAGMEGVPFPAETFPFYMPNLGPEVYSAFYGMELEYSETTAWGIPLLDALDDPEKLQLDPKNPYWLKIEEMMEQAIAQSQGRFLPAYTDLHPGLDCLAAWRDPQNLCMDMAITPEAVDRYVLKTIEALPEVFRHYHDKLQAHGFPSITWLGVPSFKGIHVPSCDFSSMLSTEHFKRFAMPILEQEVHVAPHNVFHLDGPGVARHLDLILQVPQIQAIQWVPGAGARQSITQWYPLVRKIQEAGKSVMIYLQESELDDVMRNLRPEGILLALTTDPDHFGKVIDRVKKW